MTVSGITTATAISLAYEHICALLADHAMKCWGTNTNGQLGDGTTTDHDTPVTVKGITTATAIATDLGGTCALLAGRTLRADTRVVISATLH